MINMNSSDFETEYDMNFFQDHIAEVLEKWDNIDDEIWELRFGHQAQLLFRL